MGHLGSKKATVHHHSLMSDRLDDGPMPKVSCEVSLGSDRFCPRLDVRAGHLLLFVAASEFVVSGI